MAHTWEWRWTLENGTFDYADMVNRKVNDCWKPRNLEAGESITLQPVAKMAMHLD
jgi:hypothetical protein